MSLVTVDNRGPLINVASWVVLVAAVLAAAGKVYVKWHATRALGLDDVAMLAAFALTVAVVGTTSSQVDHGLGSRSDQPPTDTEVFFKAQYATQILYVLAVGAVKLIPLYFFPTMSNKSQARSIIWPVIAATYVWMGISFFVAVFECHLPTPWQSGPGGKCINIDAFWAVNVVVDSALQIVIAVLPIYLLWNVQINQKSKKLFAMLCFMPTLVIIPLTILRYIYLRQLQTSTEYLWDAFGYAICTVLQPLFAIVTTSISFSRPILDSLVIEPHLIGDNTLGLNSAYYKNSHSASADGTGAKSKRTSRLRASNIEGLRSPISFMRTKSGNFSDRQVADPFPTDSQRSYIQLDELEQASEIGTAHTSENAERAPPALQIHKSITTTIVSSPRV